MKHLLKVQDEYKKKEAELEKIKDDKLQVEKMLENLQDKVCEPYISLSLPYTPPPSPFQW